MKETIHICVYFPLYEYISKHSAKQVHVRVLQAEKDIAEVTDLGQFNV